MAWRIFSGLLRFSQSHQRSYHSFEQEHRVNFVQYPSPITAVDYPGFTATSKREIKRPANKVTVLCFSSL